MTREHASGYMRRLCKGHGMGCFWLLLAKPKTGCDYIVLCNSQTAKAGPSHIPRPRSTELPPSGPQVTRSQMSRNMYWEKNISEFSFRGIHQMPNNDQISIMCKKHRKHWYLVKQHHLVEIYHPILRMFQISPQTHIIIFTIIIKDQQNQQVVSACVNK